MKTLSFTTFFFVLLIFSNASAQWCSRYGINAHIPDAQTLRAIKDAGISWVRMDFNWFMIEPSKGVFNFAVLDNAVDEARRLNLFVFATLAYSPKWAVADQTCQDGTNNPCHTKPPANPQDFADFVFQVVSHFKGRVMHYGMWNEPNLKDFFDGSLDDYVNKILVPGARAAKWADPEVKILAPELAGVGSSSQWNGDKGQCIPFAGCIMNGWEIDLAQVLSRASSSIDIVTHHFYKSTPTRLAQALVDGEYDDIVGVVKVHSSLKEIIEANAPGKKVWLTEYGWETTAYGGYEGGGSISEAKQASNHVEFLQLYLDIVNGTWASSDNDPWPALERVFIYDAKDSVVEGHLYAFGILRVDGTKKPAWEAIRDFISTHPEECPNLPPKFNTIPRITLNQGEVAVHAIDLYEYTEDPDTPLEALTYALTQTGDPKAGIKVEDGHFISVYPDPDYSGTTTARVSVFDGTTTAFADFVVMVVPFIPKTYSAPYLSVTLDGNLSEWGTVPQIALSPEKDYVSLVGAMPAGPLDISANARIAWDKGHIYLAFEVTDNTHYNTEPPEFLWRGDSVQFAIDFANDRTVGGYDDDDDYEVGIALIDENPVVYCFKMPIGIIDCPVTAVVQRQGNKTYYEAGFSVESGVPDKVSMSLLVNENDALGREGFLQWTEGIGLSKDPSKFGIVTLVGEIPLEMEDEVVEEAGAVVVEERLELEESNVIEEMAEDVLLISDGFGEDLQLLEAHTDLYAPVPPGSGTCGCSGSSSSPPFGEILFFVGLFLLWKILEHRKRT